VSAAPEVTVLDAGGQAMSGVAVHFAVEGDGGSIVFADVTTDAGGHASSGTWTLGTSKGTDRLDATVTGVTGVTFTALAENQSPDVHLQVNSPPYPGQLVGSSVTPAISAWGTYQLASVIAAVQQSDEPLTPGDDGRYTGDPISLAELPKGPIDLVYTATDVMGNVTDLVVGLMLDRAPVVTVDSPGDSWRAAPMLDVHVTCVDDGGVECPLVVAVENNGFGQDVQVASGTGTVDQQVDLTRWDGQSFNLKFTGTDSANQQTIVRRVVYVDQSTHLIQTARVDGPVWDASGSQVLFVDQSGATPELELEDTSSNLTSSLGNVDVTQDRGYVTPMGALFTGAGNVLEWRNGQVETVATANAWYLPNLPFTLRVAGNWAIWSTDSESGGLNALPPPILLPQGPLSLLDLSTDDVTVVDQYAFHGPNDVNANGDVVYTTITGIGDNLMRYRAGNLEQLAGGDELARGGPLTDGDEIVYVAYDNYDPSIVLNDNGQETVLSQPGAYVPPQYVTYAISNAWVAYVKLDGQAHTQVWRHGPSGEEQLTFFGSPSFVDTVLDDGTVILVNGGRRYRVALDGVLVDVGSSLGTVIVRAGSPMVLMGATVNSLQ
jgi:hypothetical protein